MYVPKQLESKIQELVKVFPAIAILGPRQLGKTTLVKKNFPTLKYFNLEELDLREFAKSDPRRFLDLACSENEVILDEIQYTPELLSYIQSRIDENRNPGLSNPKLEESAS